MLALQMMIVTGAACMKLSFAAETSEVLLVVVEIDQDAPLAQQTPVVPASGPVPRTSVVCSPTNCSSEHLVDVHSTAYLGVWILNPGSTEVTVDAVVSAHNIDDPGADDLPLLRPAACFSLIKAQ